MLRVLQVCAEIFPLLKTGGLADVAGALPPALKAAGAEARVLLPGFAAVLKNLRGAAVVDELPSRGAVPAARLLAGRLPACGGLRAYVVDAPGLYLREGGPYDDAQGQPFADNHLRFAALGWAAADLAAGADPNWAPAVVHAHDWHAALAPACVRALSAPAATIYTVHNLAYQGSFAAAGFTELGLPAEHFQPEGLEFHGHLNFMKAGLHFADRITTVSPTYAREIQQHEQGFGMDGLLRRRSAVLHGILNGVDAAVWNPASDRLIASAFNAQDLSGKARCKAKLQSMLGLTRSASAPLFIVVSRLAEQKGLHLVLQALPRLIDHGAQFAILGGGDVALQTGFERYAHLHPHSVSVRIGYDEALAHQLIAGGDVIMVPSRFEPCGLTQLYGLAYGTLPLVRRVGGLADTVTDCSLEALDDGSATGFVFDAFADDALHAAIRRALVLWRQRTAWRGVQRNAMAQRHDWSRAAGEYLRVYELALAV